MPRKHKPPNALKHGGYSATALLPGEDPAAFDKLYRSLQLEFSPDGSFENDIIETMAHLLWRKTNLATCRIAELAQNRHMDIRSEKVPQGELLIPPFETHTKVDPAAREAGIQAADDQTRTELGIAYELVEVGEPATFAGLIKDLEVQERLDSMIDKCLKRLLFVRGLKSISETSPSALPKRITGPSRAA
jgi:hypothetical protein